MKRKIDFAWVRSKVNLYRAMIIVANLALSGCASNRPSIDEAALVTDSEIVNVRSLYCAATGDAVAVGDVGSVSVTGVVMHSADWGATWQRALLDPAPSDMSLSLLKPPISGDSNSLYLSGFSTPLNNVGSALFAGLTLSPSYRGYQPKMWWSTADHGQSWHQVEPRLPLPTARLSNAYLPTVVIADEAGTQIAAADEMGKSLALLRSTDHGKIWEKQFLPKLDYIGNMFASNIDNFIVSDGHGRLAVTGTSKSDQGVIYWSGDAGATWSESHFTSLEVQKTLGLYRSPTGVLIGFGFNNFLDNTRGTVNTEDTVLFSSVDDGRTWVHAYRGSDTGPIIGIAGNGKGHVIAITKMGGKGAKSGIVLLSDDGGRTWRKATNHFSNLPFWLFGVNIIDLDNGVVIVITDRKIWRSTDGGETFQPVNSDLPDRVFVLWPYCSDGHGRIIVAGSHGMLTSSTDSGATWHRGKMLTADHH